MAAPISFGDITGSGNKVGNFQDSSQAHFGDHIQSKHCPKPPTNPPNQHSLPVQSTGSGPRFSYYNRLGPNGRSRISSMASLQMPSAPTAPQPSAPTLDDNNGNSQSVGRFTVAPVDGDDEKDQKMKDKD